MSMSSIPAGKLWGGRAPVRTAMKREQAASSCVNINRSTWRSAFRVIRGFVASILLVTMIVSPAFAERGAYTAELQEKQVASLLHRAFTEDTTDKGWYWARMVEVCTRTLMYGNPEQDPEGGRVRMTDRSVDFLIDCAAQKGFILLPKYRDKP